MMSVSKKIETYNIRIEGIDRRIERLKKTKNECEKKINALLGMQQRRLNNKGNIKGE